MDVPAQTQTASGKPATLAGVIARAAADDLQAAAEVVHGMTGGDARVIRAVGKPGDSAAEQVRGALVQYLARGTWHGQMLPLPAGYHAGPACQHLRGVIIQTAYNEQVPVWQTSLLDALRSNDSGMRHTAANLLGHAGRPEINAALVTALSDHDESVRWAAASALIHADRAGIEVLLQRLAGHTLVPEMRRVSAYVLRHTTHKELRDILAPVALALDATDYRVETPIASGDALRALHTLPAEGAEAAE